MGVYTKISGEGSTIITTKQFSGEPGAPVIKEPESHKLPEPNDWSVKSLSNGDFEIVK